MATLEVTLWGEKIRLNSDQDEEFVLRVADYLNDKMKEVQSHDDTLLTTKIAALRAAYVIAAERLMVKNEVGKITFNMMDDIDKGLKNLRL
jgi:cell division protein ZapA (FtsZ GTPase activity inhibitor)